MTSNIFRLLFTACVAVCPPLSAADRHVADDDFRCSTEFRALDSGQRRRLEKVVRDFDVIRNAIERYAADHGGDPPVALSRLVPDYLFSLPGDPFASVASFDRLPAGFNEPDQCFEYLFKSRRPVVYSISADFSEFQTGDGAWMIMSRGLRDFPLRDESRNSRGLIHAAGYWGRLQIDIF